MLLLLLALKLNGRGKFIHFYIQNFKSFQQNSDELKRKWVSTVTNMIWALTLSHNLFIQSHVLISTAVNPPTQKPHKGQGCWWVFHNCASSLGFCNISASLTKIHHLSCCRCPLELTDAAYDKFTFLTLIYCSYVLSYSIQVCTVCVH